MKVAAAIHHLRENAERASRGRCAAYVREALEAGEVVIAPHPVSAKDYGPYLRRHGFLSVPPDEPPRAGDVCVIQGCEGHPHGHMAMFDGRAWISDFVQRDIWAGPKYRALRPPMEVFRPG